MKYMKIMLKVAYSIAYSQSNISFKQTNLQSKKPIKYKLKSCIDKTYYYYYLRI